MTGFTGIVWDTRTTERLATDLGHGAGPEPIAEAGAAWLHLADELSSAGIEYASILEKLGVHWSSAQTGEVFTALRKLTGWFADAAGAAAANGARAGSHAAAIAVARLAMPGSAEIDLAARAVEAAAVVSAIAPALTGAASIAEHAAHDQRVRAARVMEVYEAATEPVARVWPGAGPAPEIVSAEPLADERAARAAVERAGHPGASGGRAAASPAPASPAVAPTIGGIPVFRGSPVSGPMPTIPASATGHAAPPPAPSTEAPRTLLAPPVPHTGALAAERVVGRGPQSTTTDESEQSLAGATEGEHAGWDELAVTDHPVAQHVSSSAQLSTTPGSAKAVG